MPRDLILGTAGHIDHGKTSLVKALTGVDCDRLPEEKDRGITIDIGFASLALGDYRLGIVDVPGHERFVKNMLAGATGFDLALLVVAADDGVMPQTREHLDILKLLGLTQGVIALTKVDLADETSAAVVALEIRELVRGSFLEDAAIVPVSAVIGRGIPELKAALAAACERVAARTAAEWFRLPIDRAFVVQGHGTVVTGTVTSGTLRVGDELDWHKGDGTTERVKVRGLNNHGVAADAVRRGQRAGVNLAGVPHDAVRRGQELATPGYLVPATVLTVRLTASPGGRRPIRHRLPVRLHLGTAEVMAAVAVLDADRVDPGAWAVAQLHLESPVTAVWGQPFVVRDASAEHTLGGGVVLQPGADRLRRRHTETLVRVEQLGSPDPAVRAAASAWAAGPAGLDPADLVRTAGVGPDATAGVAAGLVAAGTLVELVLPPNRKRLVHADRVSEVGERILAVLAKMHAESPLVTAHDRGKVFARLDYLGDEALLQADTDRLVGMKKIVADGRRVARADFKPKLTANQRKLKDAIVEEHRSAGFAPPEPKGYAAKAGGAQAVKDIFEVACAEGLLVKVSEEIYLHADAAAEMRRRVTEKLAAGPGLTVAEIRDLLGTTRKYAVPICEYLDKAGVTKRNGDLRVAAG
jgi:selenocysteine-specific elongation factor